MAKIRMINTRFWDDGYTSNLDPIEKLLFLYFLTNTSTNISGIYEIPLRKIATETGLDKEMVEKIFKRFEGDGKIFYRNGWVGIKNFIKNQNQKSPKVKKGIQIELESVPSELKDLILRKGIDTLSHSNPNSNPNLTKSNIGEHSSQGGSQTIKKDDNLWKAVLKEFETVDPKNKTYYKNKTQKSACQFLIKEYGLNTVLRVISILPKTNRIQYAPEITNPHELKERWVKLEDFIKKKPQEQKTKNKVAF